MFAGRHRRPDRLLNPRIGVHPRLVDDDQVVVSPCPADSVADSNSRVDPLSHVTISAPKPLYSSNRPASGERAIRGHHPSSSFFRAAERVCAPYSTRISGSASIRSTISANAVDDFADCLGTDSNTSR